MSRNSLAPRGFGFADAPIELYNLLDDFFTSPARTAHHDAFKVDIQENEGAYVVEADLPGVSKEEVSLSMDEDRLTIEVKQETSSEKEEKNYVHRERSSMQMSRTAYLKGSDAAGITAKLEDGVLTVNVPKVAPTSKVHKIELQ